MFGSLFRRGDRTEAPPPAPILAGMAPVEAGPERPPHPVLARMLSEVSAIDTANGFHRQLMDRVRAPLADAPNDAMASIVCDALVRLPAARFDGQLGRGQWETWALRTAIEHGTASGVVLVFSAPQMVAICRAIGDLFGQDWQRDLLRVANLCQQFALHHAGRGTLPAHAGGRSRAGQPAGAYRHRPAGHFPSHAGRDRRRGVSRPAAHRQPDPRQH